MKFVLQTIAITMSRKPQGFFRLVNTGNDSSLTVAANRVHVLAEHGVIQDEPDRDNEHDRDQDGRDALD